MGATGSERRDTAREMAKQLARGFRAHDRGAREEAIDAFTAVDARQFHYLDDTEAEHAATAFVDALWEKDAVEFQCLRDGDIDRDAIRRADYSSVRQKLRERAAIVDADQRYATSKARAWRRHKAGGDYWTPFQRSQLYEIRAALQDPEYPNKPRGGKSGPGPEPLRYVLAFELHDMKTERYWSEGIDVMVPYFARILEGVDDATN